MDIWLRCQSVKIVIMVETISDAIMVVSAAADDIPSNP